MTISLHDATAARFIHSVTALQGVLAKGAAHCADTGGDPDGLCGLKMAPDMLPLWFQVRSVGHHSLQALKGVQAGVFAPPSREPVTSFAGLEAMLTETLEGLKAFPADEVEDLQDRELVFRLGERELPYLGGVFLLTFSVPNFYFHAATAYDLLRMNGAPLGKGDYLGRLQLNR